MIDILTLVMICVNTWRSRREAGSDRDNSLECLKVISAG
jgi:hypothetical protein